MSRKKKYSDTRTLNISFDQEDVKVRFIALLRQAVKKSGLNQDQIVDRVTRLSGRKLTVHMLSNYLGGSEDKEPYNLPAFWLADFCKVCGDYEPLFSMVRDCGFEVVDKETLDYARLGQNRLAKDRIEEEDQALKLRLKKGGK